MHVAYIFASSRLLNLFYSSCKDPLCVHDPLFILLCHGACGILVPQPGIELLPPTVRAWNSNHWTTGEFPMILHSHCVFGEREREREVERDRGREGKRGHVSRCHDLPPNHSGVRWMRVCVPDSTLTHWILVSLQQDEVVMIRMLAS